jgi:4-alpha-glucanotransferase
LLGSHDTVRILSVLSGAPHRDALTREQQAAYAPSEAELALGKARLKQAVALQMAFPGVPSIYYGDEAGLTGMADPFCRKPYPWGKEDADLLAFYRAAAAARTTSPALKHGGSGLYAPREDILALLRCDKNENASALLLINRADRPAGISISAKDFALGPDAGELFITENYRDALSGQSYAFSNGEARLTLPAHGVVLLLSE